MPNHLLPGGRLRLVPKPGRSAFALLHICCPERCAAGIGESEEDTCDWNHLEKHGWNAKAAC